MGNQLVGHGSILKVDESGGSTFNEVVNGLDMTVTWEADAIESTDKSSNQHRTYEIGNDGWNVTGSGNMDLQATGDVNGYNVIRDAWINRAKVEVQVVEEGTSDTWTGTALVASISKSYPQNGIVTYNFTLTGDGAGVLA